MEEVLLEQSGSVSFLDTSVKEESKGRTWDAVLLL